MIRLDSISLTFKYGLYFRGVGWAYGNFPYRRGAEYRYGVLGKRGWLDMAGALLSHDTHDYFHTYLANRGLLGLCNNRLLSIEFDDLSMIPSDFTLMRKSFYNRSIFDLSNISSSHQLGSSEDRIWTISRRSQL